MRSVGIQPPTIARPCFICARGLNGRTYCYFCGNTKDLGGSISGVVNGRTSSEITHCLGAPVQLVPGTEYEIVLNEGKNKRTITGVCEGVSGPFASVDGYNIHLLEIDSMRIL